LADSLELGQQFPCHEDPVALIYAEESVRGHPDFEGTLERFLVDQKRKLTPTPAGGPLSRARKRVERGCEQFLPWNESPACAVMFRMLGGTTCLLKLMIVRLGSLSFKVERHKIESQL